MKKLKQQFRSHTKRNRQCVWDSYPCVHSGTHKHFSTRQEKSYFFLHTIECKEYPVKLRAARGRALPDPWDDYPSCVYDLAKSWKYNSKRCCQYYK
jgi:hypothetical protein